MARSRRAALRGVPPLVLSLAWLSACGSAGDPSSRPATPAPSAPSAAPATPANMLAPGEWASWSRAQKEAYMKSTVLPTLKPLFAGYAPKRFADIGCETCHGAGSEAKGWKMPNPALPKLEPGKIMGLYNTHREAYIFMEGSVVPRMSRLLGVPVWDHSAMNGFGCFRCHTMEK